MAKTIGDAKVKINGNAIECNVEIYVTNVINTEHPNQRKSHKLQQLIDFLSISCPDIAIYTDINIYQMMQSNITFAYACYNPKWDVENKYATHIIFNKESICLNYTLQPLDKNYAIHNLFHELCHATGAKHRLNRPAIVSAEVYNFNIVEQYIEELIADKGAVILSKHFNIFDEELEYQHAQYVHAYSKTLSDDDISLTERCAEEAAQYILNNWLSLEAYDKMIGERYAEFYERVG